VTDLDLLRSFEPVIRYTAGEQFFPMATEGYVAECDLFAIGPEGDADLLVPRGELTVQRLASAVAGRQDLFLRYVQEPMSGLELAAWQRRPGRARFRAPGRLARVGLFARLVDAGFNASLIVRGSVPGGTAAAAARKYEALRSVDARYVYHGRVLRRDGWIVLHYLFFYAMNDWRSSFFGANDHEADLEQCFVVLEERGDGPPSPVWFGCAAHDYVGDDLRRRWDDPDLVRVGDHPVIFAGAGSHAAYFEAGEYLTTMPLPASKPLRGIMEGLRSFWRNALRQGDPGDLAARVEQALSIPFIDYARGDGLAIGAGEAATWTPLLVDDATPWVDGYRGLWGLDTRDRFAGERAPAGLKYTRTGTVRQSWNDPLGFLGLDKLPPPGQAVSVMRARIEELEADRTTVRSSAEERASELRRITLTSSAMVSAGAPGQMVEALADRTAEGERDVAHLRARSAEIDAEIAALEAAIGRAQAGDVGDPHGHLHHELRPQEPGARRHGRIFEAWSAISVSIMLIVLVALLYTAVIPWWAALTVTLGGYVFLEAVLRRQLVDLILRLTVALAIVGAVYLCLTHSLELVILAILGIALLTLIDNVRELRA